MIAAARSGTMENAKIPSEARSAERRQGINVIESDLIPRLERIENHDAEVAPFFQKFRRVIVIDHRQTPTFSEGRLASFMTLESERISDDFVIRYYVPR
jgi:hypothetical protein